jgi:hypothetical protein
MEEILAGALKLLKTLPNGADSVSMHIGGGADEPVMPHIERYMIPILASRGGSKLMQRTRMRPEYDLHGSIRHNGKGGFNIAVERKTGMAAFASMMDPSEFIGSSSAETPEAAVEALREILSSVEAKGVSLTLLSIAYWSDQFADRTFSADREASARAQPRRWRDVLSPYPDTEVSTFADEVVTKAFAWGEGEAGAESLSLWFYANNEYSAAYCTITVNGDGTYELKIEDRIPWPWVEKKPKTLRTQQQVQAAIVDHLVSTHRFKLQSLRVYFNYGQRLAA